MQDNPVALVTGANKGIGLQIAKDLAARGFTVLVGSRNLERGETAAKSVGADARRPPARRHESGLHRRRVRAHPERARASRRAGEQRGRLACGKAGQVARGDREVGPRERRVSRRGARGVRDERVRRHRRHASDASTPS